MCSNTKLETIYVLLEREIKMCYIRCIFYRVEINYREGCMMKFVGSEPKRYWLFVCLTYVYHTYNIRIWYFLI